MFSLVGLGTHINVYVPISIKLNMDTKLCSWSAQVAWSLQQQALGKWPTKGHDGALLTNARDSKQNKKAGSELGLAGVLC